MRIGNCKRPFFLGGLVFGLIVLLGSMAQAGTKAPIYNVGYIFTTHQTPLIVAMSKGEEFKDFGVYLKPVVEKMKYALMDGDTKLATLNIIVAKNGSETTTLFAMDRMDIGLASGTAIMSGIDKGTKIKIVCPLHVDGMGLVFPKGSTVTGWDGVLAYIKNSKRPVKIGYHSPTSAPRIVIEGALNKAGLKVTQDATDFNADVLLVDLKSTSNLIPALMGKQVDAWVGPAPHPEVAELKNVGHIALDLRDLPPAGEWHNFPCCVMAVRQDIIDENPTVVEKMVELMTKCGEWSNTHTAEQSQIVSRWIGVPAEAVEKSTIIYTTTPSDNWMHGEAVFLDILNGMHKFKGQLKDKTLAEAKPFLYDFRFVH
ncbi:MAG: ABC transporter substrate-binding protein [Desulfoplanes sp.]|nr:ABC transporter substrate-binding protein [Desulfoplanes sp.]